MGLIDPNWKLAPTDPEVARLGGRADNELRGPAHGRLRGDDRLAWTRASGRILAALDEAGVADNTLVMFLSDNGGCSENCPSGHDFPPSRRAQGVLQSVGPGWGWAQNTPFRRYKSWVHEGGISTPLIARWPGVVEPAR